MRFNEMAWNDAYYIPFDFEPCDEWGQPLFGLRVSGETPPGGNEVIVPTLENIPPDFMRRYKRGDYNGAVSSKTLKRILAKVRDL